MTNFSERELRDRAAARKHAKNYQNAMPQFIEEQGGDLYFTLSFHRGGQHVGTLRRHLQNYFGEVERKLLGHRFYKRPKEMRFRGWFFAEKIDVNAHWHGIVHLPRQYGQFLLKRVIVVRWLETQWNKAIPSGNAKIDLVGSQLKGGSRYVTKERRRIDFSDQMVTLEEFWPQSKPGRIV